MALQGHDSNIGELRENALHDIHVDIHQVIMFAVLAGLLMMRTCRSIIWRLVLIILFDVCPSLSPPSLSKPSQPTTHRTFIKKKNKKWLPYSYLQNVHIQKAE
mgnify:CR=1 FL=1